MNSKSVWTERFWQLWSLSWPLILANSFWNIQMTVDRIYLAAHGTESLAAATGAIGIFWAPMALLHQTAAYVSTFVAQYIGQKDENWVGPSLWQSFYVCFIGGILFLFLIPFAPGLFQLIGHSAKLQSLEVDYFQMLCWSALPTALLASVAGFLTGLEKSRLIIFMNLFAVILNIGLDHILVLGTSFAPAMGVTGAGLATALANAGAAIYGLWVVFQEPFRRRFNLMTSWRWRPELFTRFLKFGVPSGLQWALEGLAFTSFHILIGHMGNGESALAANGVAVTVMMLAILPSLGVAQGVSVLVGKSLGEGRPELAKSYSWIGLQIALLYVVIMGISFIAIPDFYLSFFMSADSAEQWQTVRSLVPVLLMMVSVALVFDTAGLIFSSVLKGAGDTKFVSLVALLVPWPMMVLPSWWVVGWPNGVYWAWASASSYMMVQALIFFWRFNKGPWQKIRVT